MIKSIFKDLPVEPSEIVVLVSSMNALETILPIIWAEKQINPKLQVKAVFMRERTLTGYGKTHPLLILATELMDEMLLPFGLGWIHWKGKSENSKIERLFKRSSRLTRGLNLTRGFNVWAFGSAVNEAKKIMASNNQHRVTIFDYAYFPGDSKYQSFIKAFSDQAALGISHVSTLNMRERPSGYVEERQDGSYFSESLSSLSAIKKIVLFFDSMDEELEINNLHIKLPTIYRFDLGWLAYLDGIFRKKLEELQAAGPVGLLVSTEGAKGDRALRRRALIDIRFAFENLGWVPAILMHPSEARKDRELRGWTVITDIHYSVMFGLAEQIVTFGSQIAEDSYRMNKKMIEYLPVRKATFQSEYHKFGKTLAAHSLSELKTLLVTNKE